MYKNADMNRKIRKKCLVFTLSACLAAAAQGCSGNGNTEGNTNKAAVEEAALAAGEDSSAVVLDTENMFTARDKEIGWEEEESITIKLDKDVITASSDDVSVDGSTAVITKEGVYIISGSLKSGQIIVDAQKNAKIQLVLDGASINSKTSAPVYVRQADKVFITLAADTENLLSNQGEFTAIDDNNIDSVIFSKDDLTLNGEGSLTVNTEYGHGIVSKDDLVITSGTYEITAAGHGMAGKDSVRIAGGSFDITSGKDGIHSENTDDASLGYVYIADGTFTITAQTDGIDGAAAVQADGGTFHITTGGGSENASTDKSGSENPGWGHWGEKTEEGKEPPSIPPLESQNQPDGTVSPPSFEPLDKAGTPSQKADDTGILPSDGKDGEDTAAADEAHTDETQDAAPSAKAVKADGDIIIKDGIYTIDSSDDSIHANGNVYIYNGTFHLSSGDDGIHADTTASIQGGSIEIVKSYEGIEGKNIEITNGTVSIVSSDDGINAAGGSDGSGVNQRPGQGSFDTDADCYIKISGGVITVTASGDGIDSNSNLYVSGGEVYVTCTSGGGDGAFDYDGTAEITGGIVFAAGPGQMAQNFSDTSTQGSILVSSQNGAQGPVVLKDSQGKELASFTPASSYDTAAISCPALKQGETYTVVMGDEEQTVEMTSLIYGLGSAGTGRGGSFPNKGKGGEREKPTDKPA